MWLQSLLSIDNSNYLHRNANIHLCTSNSSLRFGLRGCVTTIFKSEYVFNESNLRNVELIDVRFVVFCYKTEIFVLCLMTWDSFKFVLLFRRVIDLGSAPIIPHSSYL